VSEIITVSILAGWGSNQQILCKQTSSAVVAPLHSSRCTRLSRVKCEFFFSIVCIMIFLAVTHDILRRPSQSGSLRIAYHEEGQGHDSFTNDTHPEPYDRPRTENPSQLLLQGKPSLSPPTTKSKPSPILAPNPTTHRIRMIVVVAEPTRIIIDLHSCACRQLPIHELQDAMNSIMECTSARVAAVKYTDNGNLVVSVVPANAANELASPHRWLQISTTTSYNMNLLNPSVSIPTARGTGW
jgi:hypothetical protein